MRVNSTGLGKTTLTSHISELAPAEEPTALTMKIESTQPVHWYITCQMDSADIRAAMRMVLKPAVLLRIAKLALRSGKKSGSETEITAQVAGKTS